MTTWRFGLLGENIQYSKSPAIFQAISRQIDREIEFNLLHLQEQSLRELLEALCESEYTGVSVTIPYKRSVLELVNATDPEATAIGAANAIHFQSGVTTAFNTDWMGFLQPLQQCKIDTRRTLVLGTGGGADAVVYALHHHFMVDTFSVIGRNEEHVMSFAKRQNKNLGITLKPAVQDAAPFSLVINCSPVGGFNDPDAEAYPQWVRFAPRAVYYDLNYNLSNRNLDRAKQAGCTVFDGRVMLVAQAIASFHRWTGIKVPFAPIFDAVFGQGESHG